MTYQTTNIDADKPSRLCGCGTTWGLSFAAMVLYLGALGAVAGVTFKQRISERPCLPTFVASPFFDSNTMQGFPVFIPSLFDYPNSSSVPENVRRLRPARSGCLPIGWLVVYFLLVSVTGSVVQLFSVANDHQMDQRGHPNIRMWVEYSLGAPSLVVLIAALAGINQWVELIALATLTFTTMPFGYAVEVMVQHGETFMAKWMLFCGFIPQAAVWGVIIVSYVRLEQSSPSTDAQVPAWVVAIFVLECALFMGFGILLGVFVFVRRWTHHKRNAFILLNLVSKSLLAWLVFSFALVDPAENSA